MWKRTVSAAALSVALSVLIPLGGCGSDAKDTAAATTKAENPEQIFKEILQKSTDKNIPIEEFSALSSPSAATFMTTPEYDGRAELEYMRNRQSADLKRENIQVSNIQTRESLMSADITGTAVFTEQGQKKQVPISGTAVLRNEDGIWKQLHIGIVEVTPIKSIEVISGGMQNVSIHGNIGKTFSGEQAVFLSFKNNSPTNYSFGWVQPPTISAVTDLGETLARAIPKYDLTPPSIVFRIKNEPIWIILPFPEAKGAIREIRFTDFHVLDAGGLPTDSFETPVLNLHLTI